MEAAIAQGSLALAIVPGSTEATDWLARQLKALDVGPFDQPVVLAHHPALRRALTLGIARGTGCAASMRFVSPTAWVDEVAGLEGLNGEWRPAAMTWRLTQSLVRQDELLPESARALVRAGDTIAILNFAREVAARFRNYLLYRPDLLIGWEAGHADQGIPSAIAEWQRALWLDLVGNATRSPARIVADLRAGRFEVPDSVGPVILMVADPTTPPTVREAIHAIARQREVRWCVVAFAGLSSEARISPRLRAATSDVLTGLAAPQNPPVTGRNNLLGAVQRRLRGDTKARAVTLDDTLTLHACHSALREVETLRERAIAALEADPALRPHDITLYVTTLRSYLPAIDAVFRVDEPGVPKLPYEVAGRPFRERSPVAFALLSLLEAAEGRQTLEEIASLLRLEPVARAGHFGELEVAAVPGLLAQAGVVWGVDGNERRERFGLPPINSGTWRHGLDRLVLGVATGPVGTPLGDILPIAGNTTGNTDLLERLVGWTDELFDLFTALRNPRPANEWLPVLERATRSFIRASGSDDFEALRGLRGTIDQLLMGLADVSAGAMINLATVRHLLEQRLEEAAGEMGHLRGGMRVCTLEPGTVLPAKVVLIAGADDALHPGGGFSPAWDLLASAPADTDPDHRSDMLDIFRQAVLSGESRVHVAWTGFSAVRHDRRAPSVAVSELRDLAALTLGDGHQDLVIDEPAHPFSTGLFADVPDTRTLRSSSQSWADAARLIRTRGAEHRPFADTALPRAEDQSRVVAVHTLAECIKDPTLYFCKRVLGLSMSEDEELLNCEPQSVAPAGDQGVHNYFRTISWRIEEAQRDGDTRGRDEIAEWLRHQPEMPYGEEGRVLGIDVARSWWPKIQLLREISWLPPHPIEVPIGEWTITGRLDRLTTAARVVESFYEIRPHSAIGHWVNHLVMNVLAQRGEAIPVETHFRGAPEWRLKAVDDAESQLLNLCRMYDDAHRAPQPLFRNTGCAWLEKLGIRPASEVDETTLRAAFAEANSRWQTRPVLPGQAYFAGEGDRPWTNLCWANRGFDDDDEFVAAFTATTERVLLPFMRSRVAAQ